MRARRCNELHDPDRDDPDRLGDPHGYADLADAENLSRVRDTGEVLWPHAAALRAATSAQRAGSPRKWCSPSTWEALPLNRRLALPLAADRRRASLPLRAHARRDDAGQLRDLVAGAPLAG